MRVVVFGATSGIASACLRIWAETADQLTLIGRNEQVLADQQVDLRIRSTMGKVDAIVHDLSSVDGIVRSVTEVFDAGSVDIALVAFGTMPDQSYADADPAIAASLLELNGSMTLISAHLIALRMIDAGFGRLGVIGSVAGDRGRQSNYLYGAAKAMVATGVAGLQHRCHGTGVTVTLIKPGPTDTPMTAHLRGRKGPLAPVGSVAAEIVAGIDAGRPVVYTPKRWRLIMAIIRALPRGIFHRTNL